MRRTVCNGITVCLLACGLLVAKPALARDEGAPAAREAQEEQEPEQEAGMEQMAEVEDETEFRFGYRGSVSAFGGGVAGGTPIGTVENVFFNSTFETGGDGAFGIRGTMPVWWRLAGELEFLTTSPGVEVTLTDPAGQDRSVFPFGPLDVSYVAASVRFDLANAWINPFLQAGVAGVRFSGENSSETSLGLLYGGGVEVPVPRVEGVFGRVDVRGLRADIAGTDLPAELVTPDEGVIATQIIWTVGLGYRF